jgi:hypothetical protein
MSLVDSFRTQVRRDSIQRPLEPCEIRIALAHRFFSSKVKRSPTSTFRTLANFSSPATEGEFTPRSTRTDELDRTADRLCKLLFREPSAFAEAGDSLTEFSLKHGV